MSDNSIPLNEAECNRRVLAAFRILATAAKRKHAEQTGRGTLPPSEISPLTDRLF